MFCLLGNTLVQEDNIKKVKFQYSFLKNDIMNNIKILTDAATEHCTTIRLKSKC